MENEEQQVEEQEYSEQGILSDLDGPCCRKVKVANSQRGNGYVAGLSIVHERRCEVPE